MVRHRDIGALLFMICNDICDVDMRNAVAIGNDDIFFIAMIEEARDPLERFQTIGIGCIGLIRIGRQQDDAAVLSREVPVLAAAEVVDQRLIIVFGDDADCRDPRIDHVGEREIDEAITSAVRDGRHRPVAGELRNVFIMYIGKNNSNCRMCHLFTPPYSPYPRSDRRQPLRRCRS